MTPVLRLIRIVVVLGPASIGAACVSGAPVEEARAFAEAADAVTDAGTLLFDGLAVAERQRRQELHNANPAQRYEFNVDDAPYFATIGEPPGTESFRRALAVVTAYADLVVALVEGKDVAASKSYLVQISNDLKQITGIPGVAVAVQTLDPLIDHALRAHSVAEARRLVLQGTQGVEDLLLALKNAAPTIYSTMIYMDRKVPGSSESKTAKLNADRTKVANFVVLLDRLRATFGMLKVAFEHQNGRAGLAELAAESARLRADVDAARKVFAGG
ncbi:hypothetical protein [Sinorhizobium saheli]|uniref:Uncharacterized protein n=1 Tax=Sinorhizobium saheli TaxID=36856 RepID=A0A178Y7P8_SINSA|nr:hypothetical protein [Sinorhizobium saheli]MQW86174.1 hypothetical protein [Sinorhizobium saheli]OAP43550.1 hypothetical protein ATB98_24500 [Sinorhizobium saheli]